MEKLPEALQQLGFTLETMRLNCHSMDGLTQTPVGVLMGSMKIRLGMKQFQNILLGLIKLLAMSGFEVQTVWFAVVLSATPESRALSRRPRASVTLTTATTSSAPAWPR